MKILITGFSGFVASHFVEYLYRHDIDAEIYGISRRRPSFDYEKYRGKLKIFFHEMNLLDRERLLELTKKIIPDYVLHLAASSSVAYSWQNPEESFKNNCNIFLNLVNVIKKVSPCCRILSVGSSEEYGNVAQDNLPIRENNALSPLSPYAVARVAQEQLSKVYVDAFGMKIIMTRSFNHIGPRQDERFVVPSFVKKILNIKISGQTHGLIETGDVSIVRDFVDVRDVVDAYYRLLIDGTVGEVYNVCSGRATSLAKIIEIIAAEVGVKIATSTNPKLIRPKDSKEIVGSPYKIQTELGWTASIALTKTIRDILKDKS